MRPDHVGVGETLAVSVKPRSARRTPLLIIDARRHAREMYQKLCKRQVNSYLKKSRATRGVVVRRLRR
jgi:hypothetical protein